MKWLTLHLELVTPCFIGGAVGSSGKRDLVDFSPTKSRDIERLRRSNNQQDRDNAKRLKRELTAEERRARDSDDLAAEMLRPASVIGHLRFWLRTILGASDCSDEGQPLTELESQMFGSVRQGPMMGQGAVKVRPGLRILPPEDLVVLASAPTLRTLVGSADYLKFVHGQDRQGRDRFIDPLGYLGYGLMDAAMDLALERPAIKAGTRLDIEVAVRAHRQTTTGGQRRNLSDPEIVKQEEQDWQLLRYAVWLWHTFGGIGARSRHGWGSIQVVGLEGLDAIPTELEQKRWREWFPALKQESANEEQRRTQSLRRVLGLALGKNPDQTDSYGKLLQSRFAYSTEGLNPQDEESARGNLGESDFSHLGSSCAIIPLASDDATSWVNALADFGLAMLEIRSNAAHQYRDKELLRVADHDKVAEMLDGVEPADGKAPYRAAFGLPHNYYFSGGGKTQFQGPSGDRRRASPVLMHVAKAWDARKKRFCFVPSVLWLKSHLVSSNVHRSVGQHGEKRYDPPDWSAVVAFLQEFLEPESPRGGRVP